jgi:hypothetical protein
MKIFLSFLQGRPGHPIPAYGFWEYYIKQGIQEAGHEWTECKEVDWAYGLVPQPADAFRAWKTGAWEKTLAYLEQDPPDIFLSYLYPSQVDEAAINEIRRRGIPCVNFFCDNIRQFRRIPEAYRVFDLNWVPEHKALAMYHRQGMPYIHLPMPMWVDPRHRALKDERLEQVTFIGSWDIQRQLLFEGIVACRPDLPLAVYGEAWTAPPVSPAAVLPVAGNYGLMEKIAFQGKFIRQEGIAGYVRKFRQRNFKPAMSPELKEYLRGKPDFAAYIRLSQESYITAGINRYPSFRHPLDRPDTYSRLRDIEAPMLGACYLTEWTEGLDDMYRTGSEIEVYRSADQFCAVAGQLLKHKDKRMEMRKLAQKRALGELSILHSLAKINARLR